MTCGMCFCQGDNNCNNANLYPVILKCNVLTYIAIGTMNFYVGYWTWISICGSGYGRSY